ncbi:MAG: hypothetical protein M3Q58_11920 [Bacteroidota bacterium]|nr:hypothetical protein [Bacteroidota bacterium]
MQKTLYDSVWFSERQNRPQSFRQKHLAPFVKLSKTEQPNASCFILFTSRTKFKIASAGNGTFTFAHTHEPSHNAKGKEPFPPTHKFLLCILDDTTHYEIYYYSINKD